MNGSLTRHISFSLRRWCRPQFSDRVESVQLPVTAGLTAAKVASFSFFIWNMDMVVGPDFSTIGPENNARPRLVSGISNPQSSCHATKECLPAPRVQITIPACTPRDVVYDARESAAMGSVIPA